MANEKYICNCDRENLPEWCPARQARYYRILEFVEKISCPDSTENDLLARAEAGYTAIPLEARKLLREIGESNE